MGKITLKHGFKSIFLECTFVYGKSVQLLNDCTHYVNLDNKKKSLAQILDEESKRQIREYRYFFYTQIITKFSYFINHN